MTPTFDCTNPDQTGAHCYSRDSIAHPRPDRDVQIKAAGQGYRPRNSVGRTKMPISDSARKGRAGSWQAGIGGNVMGMGHAGPKRGRDEHNQRVCYFVNFMVVLTRNIFITAL